VVAAAPPSTPAVLVIAGTVTLSDCVPVTFWVVDTANVTSASVVQLSVVAPSQSQTIGQPVSVLVAPPPPEPPLLELALLEPPLLELALLEPPLLELALLEAPPPVPPTAVVVPVLVSPPVWEELVPVVPPELLLVSPPVWEELVPVVPPELLLVFPPVWEELVPVVPPVLLLEEELEEPPLAPPEPVALLLLGTQAAPQRPARKASPTTRVLVW
jgi:hypothetical protein